MKIMLGKMNVAIYLCFVLMTYQVTSSLTCKTFVKYTKHALYGFNNLMLVNSNIASCRQKCLETLLTGTECKSFEFTNSATCILSSENRQSQPKSYGKHGLVDYYEKSCEIPEENLDPGDCKQNQVGSRYTGSIDRTISGRLCQRWDSQTPHGHGYKQSSKFPDGSRGYRSNYCRAPDPNPYSNSPGGPWCYTSDPDVRWEYCNIPECTSQCNKPCYKNPCKFHDGCRNYLARKNGACSTKYCSNCDVRYYGGNKQISCDKATAPPPFSLECRLSELGAEYLGTVNTTAYGKTCQRWDNQHPHKHKVTNMHYDDNIQAANNYCRNPTLHSVGLWCYTTDPSTRWQKCSVPVCPKQCKHPDMVQLSVAGDIRCYSFFLDIHYQMPWHEASPVCSNYFGDTAKHMHIKTEKQFQLILANVKGYLKMLTDEKAQVPEKILLWYGQVQTDLVPLQSSNDEDISDKYLAVRIWPGEPELEYVSTNVTLGFVCNEVNYG